MAMTGASSCTRRARAWILAAIDSCFLDEAVCKVDGYSIDSVADMKT
jgi:hypothetical protein